MNRAPLFFTVLTALLLLAGCSPNSDSQAPAAPEPDSATAPETTADSVSTTTRSATPDTAVPRDANGHIRPEALTQAFIDRKTAQARQAVKAFATALKSELKTALEHGGPLEALSVCHTRAPEITRRFSSNHGMTLSRVSAKYRNPANEAIGWQKKVLDEFEAAQRAGKPVQSLEHSEIVEIKGRQVFRYMKAIPTGKVCLTCHGSDLSPALQDKLHELYPLDKATGFKAGDIRGAFVVTEPL